MSEYIDPRAKLFCHLDRLAALKAGEPTPPVNVEIDLSNRCNLGCRACHFAYVHSRGPNASRATHDTGDLLDTSLALSILGQLSMAGVRSVTWTGGGEPLLHPEFRQIASWAQAVGIDQGIYTNGTRVDEWEAAVLKGTMQWVYVSLDRHSRESYREYKQADLFEKACNGVRLLAQAKGPATVGVGFLLDAGNWRNVAAMAALGADLGADYVQFRPAVQPDEPRASRLWINGFLVWLDTAPANVIADRSRFEAYRDWQGHPYQQCYWARLQATVTPDGRVWRCVNRRGFQGDCLGDLNTEAFADIWARATVYPVDGNCRVMCRGHIPNLALNDMMGEHKHANFI